MIFVIFIFMILIFMIFRNLHNSAFNSYPTFQIVLCEFSIWSSCIKSFFILYLIILYNLSRQLIMIYIFDLIWPSNITIKPAYISNKETVKFNVYIFCKLVKQDKKLLTTILSSSTSIIKTMSPLFIYIYIYTYSRSI